MRRLFASLIAVCIAVLGAPPAADAHFLVLLPSTDSVAADGETALELKIEFTHPMEQGPVMHMAPPARFGVLHRGQRLNLLDALRPRQVGDATAYSARFEVRRPGDHIFYIAPAPYWEPAERKMIIHYTKVIVDGMGAGDAWDQPVGLPVEIEPLVRPYGLWTGNLFRGIVRRGGEPAPFAEVEVEYYNEGGRVVPPGDAFVTQVIKADGQGVFSYAIPRAGWWGFAALVEGEETMTAPDGEEVEVELGGLIWVRAVDMVEGAAAAADR